MSVVGEVVGVIACVAALVSAYRDSGDIIDRIKKKRAERRAAPPSRLLEESVDQAPEDIEREKQRGVVRFGRTFEQGDNIAVIALQQITIQLQGSLLAELKNAAYDDAITDFRYLVDAADTGRDKTVDTLIQFRQRLLVAEPINEISPTTLLASSPPQPQLAYSSKLPHAPTWTPGYVTEVTEDEDTNSGAESRATRNRKRHSSLLGFFKHNRNPSGSQTPVMSVVEEVPRRQTIATPPKPSAKPLKSIVDVTKPAPPLRSDTMSMASGVSGHSESDQTQAPSFQYEEWEDDPAKVWGDPSPEENRESAPMERQASQARSSSSIGAPPSSLSPGTMRQGSIASSFMRTQSIAVPHPSPDNEYLGFCKGAHRLQNGDKNALKKCTEYSGDAYSRTGYSQNSAPYLRCSSSKCCYRSHLKLDIIWTKVFKVERLGLQFRWKFLANSHVAQKVAKDKTYSYQCLFCVYAGEQTPVFAGADLYLEHVSTHRGPAGEVVLYKTGCVNDRICEDSEAFDINLFPPETPDDHPVDASHMLSDDMMGLTIASKAELPGESKTSASANEPWNAGLSNFHYSDEWDRTELE